MKFLGQQTTPVELLLRIGVFGTFIGHGLFAFSQKVDWIPFLTFWGFSQETALKIMPVIGVVDIFVAVLVLLRPLKPVVIYAFIWAFLTALMRPLTGQGMLEFIERSANWAVPAALYFVLNAKSDKT